VGSSSSWSRVWEGQRSGMEELDASWTIKNDWRKSGKMIRDL